MDIPPDYGFAEGGRIGMAEGDTPSEAYLRDLYYDGGWDDRGDIGLHEFMHGPIGWKAWQDYIGKAEGGRIGFKSGAKGCPVALLYAEPNRPQKRTTQSPGPPQQKLAPRLQHAFVWKSPLSAN